MKKVLVHACVFLKQTSLDLLTRPNKDDFKLFLQNTFNVDYYDMHNAHERHDLSKMGVTCNMFSCYFLTPLINSWICYCPWHIEYGGKVLKTMNPQLREIMNNGGGDMA